MAQTMANKIDAMVNQAELGSEPLSELAVRLHDILDEIRLQTVATLPTLATAGYEDGEVLRLDGAVLGQSPLWVNVGSISSCKFVPLRSPVAGYAPVWGFIRDDITGNALTTHAYVDNALAADLLFGQLNETNNNEWFLKAATAGYGKVAVTASADGAGAVSHAILGLRQYGIPGYGIVAAGEHDCLTAETTTIAWTVAGVKAGDIALVSYSVADNTTDIVEAVCCTTNTITITASVDPGTDGTHSWDYVVFRKLDGSFQPSHYIAYAGAQASAGGDATEVITITGALATDTAIVSVTVMDDSDNIGKAILTDDTLTLTCSADPTAAAKTYNYMILRAY